MIVCPWGAEQLAPRIRRGVPADAPALAELAERTFRETYAPFNSPADMEGYVAAHFGPDRQVLELQESSIVTLVAEEDGRLAGYAQLRRSDPPACVTGASPMEVLRFYVDRPWHGRGVAQRLMGGVEAAARAEGARTLWLGVWERNQRGIAFYRKCGFRQTGVQTFVLGTDRQRDFVLVRDQEPT